MVGTSTRLKIASLVHLPNRSELLDICVRHRRYYRTLIILTYDPVYVHLCTLHFLDVSVCVVSCGTVLHRFVNCDPDVSIAARLIDQDSAGLATR